MKDSLYSFLRHALTALAGLGGYLAAKGWIAAGDAAGLDSAGAAAADALAAVGAALLARLLIFAVGKPARGTAGLMLGMIGLAGFMGFSLPACSPGAPVRVGVETDYGAASYSSKGGLTVTVDRRSNK